jgi:predicted transcriptional regulator
MDVLYQYGRASGQDILKRLSEPKSYSTIRTLLGILERKGLIRHEEEGLRYVYEPVVAKSIASDRALERVVKTFFGGSGLGTIAALLANPNLRLTDCELDDLCALVQANQRRRENN